MSILKSPFQHPRDVGPCVHPLDDPFVTFKGDLLTYVGVVERVGMTDARPSPTTRQLDKKALTAMVEVVSFIVPDVVDLAPEVVIKVR